MSGTTTSPIDDVSAMIEVVLGENKLPSGFYSSSYLSDTDKIVISVT